MVETMKPAAGGGGGIDKNPPPVDFKEPDDDPNDRKEIIKRAVVSADYILRFGGLKPQYVGVLPPELAEIAQRRSDLRLDAGDLALQGFNIPNIKQSSN